MKQHGVTPKLTLEPVGDANRKIYFPVLDGLRGVAALAVVFYHYFDAAPLRLFPRGYLAVDFFFMLSGFVVQQSYGSKEISVKTFLVQRLIRLYPMIFIGSLAGALAFGADYSGGIAWMGFFLIPSLSTETLFPFNGPLWSMFFEVVINVVFILVLRNMTFTKLVILCGLACACLVVYGHSFHQLSIGWGSQTYWGGYLKVTFSFTLGMVLNRVFGFYEGKIHVKAILCVPVVILILAVPHITRGDYVVDLIILIIILPICLCVGTLSASRNRVLSFLGAMSYPIYLLNIPLKQVLITGDSGRSFEGPCIALCVTTAVAYITLKFVDEPLRKWLAGKARGLLQEQVFAR